MQGMVCCNCVLCNLIGLQNFCSRYQMQYRMVFMGCGFTSGGQEGSVFAPARLWVASPWDMLRILFYM